MFFTFKNTHNATCYIYVYILYIYRQSPVIDKRLERLSPMAYYIKLEITNDKIFCIDVYVFVRSLLYAKNT